MRQRLFDLVENALSEMEPSFVGVSETIFNG